MSQALRTAIEALENIRDLSPESARDIAIQALRDIEDTTKSINTVVESYHWFHKGARKILGDGESPDTWEDYTEIPDSLLKLITDNKTLLTPR